MAQIRSVDGNEARDRLKDRSRRREVLAPLREVVSRLTDVTVRVDAGRHENLTAITRNISQAAEGMGRRILYRVNAEAVLIICLKKRASRHRQRRRMTGALARASLTRIRWIGVSPASSQRPRCHEFVCACVHR
jgi:hypothetical protein